MNKHDLPDCASNHPTEHPRGETVPAWVANRLLDILEKNNYSGDVLSKLSEILTAITQMENRIMTQISGFSERVNAQLNTIGTAVDGVVADVAFLKAKITELQGTPGVLTPEDTALVDALEARINTMSTTIASLDAATDPSTFTTGNPAVNPVGPVVTGGPDDPNAPGISEADRQARLQRAQNRRG